MSQDPYVTAFQLLALNVVLRASGRTTPRLLSNFWISSNISDNSLAQRAARGAHSQGSGRLKITTQPCVVHSTTGLKKQCAICNLRWIRPNTRWERSEVLFLLALSLPLLLLLCLLLGQWDFANIFGVVCCSHVMSASGALHLRRRILIAALLPKAGNGFQCLWLVGGIKVLNSTFVAQARRSLSQRLPLSSNDLLPHKSSRLVTFVNIHFK